MTDKQDNLRPYQLLEKLYESSKSQVFRAQKLEAQDTVILKVLTKNYPSDTQLAWFRHEYELMKKIDSPYIPKAAGLVKEENRWAIVMEDIGAEGSLDKVFTDKPDLRVVLEIAIQSANGLLDINKVGIIHKGINPDNIVFNPVTKRLQFIDFGLATELSLEQNTLPGKEDLEGMLPYISPEQTGRINRAVDERSDLYSLGVVLYELLTGWLPFDSKDPMVLAHHHIARVPVAPAEVSPEIPEVVSAIIMKLLEKNAEQRYQTAGGLAADLQHCRTLLRDNGQIEAFTLGEEDVSDRLRIPDRLYGRQAEIEQIVAAYERAAAGGRELLLVAGAPGVGKSALVREVQPAVTARGGLFAKGKFDQYQRVVPFTALTQAFTSLCRIILGEPEEAFESWHAKLQGALGEIGQVAVDLVPALEKIVGPQPEVPPLEGQAAQNRLYYLLARLVGAIAGPEHPLLLFIDDVQWIDSASLGLLEALLLDPQVDGLLVVGAFRDNEVDETHIFTTAQHRLRSEGFEIETLTLGDLNFPALTELVSDTVGHGSEELAGVLHGKTAGNPLFAHRLLSRMADEGHLRFDPDDRCWQWDLDAIRGLLSSDNVVDLLALQVSRLPEETRGLLELGSCIGDRFDIDLLTGLQEMSSEDVARVLARAVAERFVTEHLGTYRFVHDRVQQAAHSRMNPEQRARAHLRIGRVLESASRDDNLLAVVDHLAQARELLSKSELLDLASLDLQAARAAGRAVAFDAGLAYAKAGLDLLGEDAWERHYRLTLALHEQAALMAYSAGDIPGMEHHGEQVLQSGRDPLDLARVQRMRMEFLTASNRLDESLELGLETLRILGQEFPPNPDWELAAAKVAELNDRIERENPDFLSMPSLNDQDPQLAASSEIMTAAATAAYMFHPALCPLIIERNLELCLTRQLLSPSSPWIISAYGVYVGSLLGKNEAGFAYGEIAVRLAEKEAFRSFMSSALFHQATYLHFWRNPLRETLDIFMRSIKIGHDYGNNEFIAYSSKAWPKHALCASIDIGRVVEQATQLRAFLDAVHYDMQSRWLNVSVTAALALRGNSSARGIIWRGTPFDDDRDLPYMQQTGDQFGLLTTYSAKGWVATLFGDHEGAEQYSDLACSVLEAGPGVLENAIVAFVCGLRYARELRENPDRAESEQALEEQVGLLERYARLAPMNFAHKLALVQAEVHRARGEVLEAMQAYEQASQGARENDYLNDAGLAHALAAEFYQDLGLHQAALHNAEQAAQAWRNWGAHALVESLAQRWPALSTPADLTWETIGRSGISNVAIDLSTVTKASQILAGEIVLGRLLTKMMKLVIENAGATRGYLILEKGQQWVIEAVGNVDRTDVEVLQSIDVETQEEVSTGIVNYVVRSAKMVLLHDAVNDGEFTADPTVQSTNAKSILCFPLVDQGQISGILYLENNLTTGAFTDERVELLELLSAQMAMALDNACLYSDLAGSESRFRSLVENANEAIVVGQDKTVKYGNPQVSKLTGYTPEELGSRDFVEFIHPEDREIILGEYKTRLSGERPASSYSIRIIAKDGQEKHVFVNSALIDWDGKPATLAMLTDITDRKRAEEQMNQLRSELIHTARTSTMGEMTAALAHELNHPLGSILNNAYAARRFLEQDDPDLDEIRDIINDIISEDRRANEVMQKVRNLMKKTEVGLAPVKINSIIEEVLKLTHSELIIENVSLSKQLEKDLPQVTGERIQLQQVFINLIMNAVDAMKESKTKELHVSTARHDADNVVVCIRDTGAGFTDEEQGKLFKPFFTTKEEGMGMGLSVTKTIVRSHGGEIWAENNEEAGASFLITLPVYNERSHE